MSATISEVSAKFDKAINERESAITDLNKKVEEHIETNLTMLKSIALLEAKINEKDAEIVSLQEQAEKPKKAPAKRASKKGVEETASTESESV